MRRLIRHYWLFVVVVAAAAVDVISLLVVVLGFYEVRVVRPLGPRFWALALEVVEKGLEVKG